MNIKERAKHVTKTKKITYDELSKLLNIPKDTISNYMGGRRSFSIEFIESFVVYFNINANWLLTGNGEMYNLPTNQVHSNNANHNHGVSLPFYENIKISAGYGEINHNEEQSYFCIDKKLIEQANIKDLVVVLATGNSMQPVINNNDYLIIEYGTIKEIQDSAIYIVRINDSLLVKSIRPTIDGIELISFNKEYTPQSIPKLALEDGRAEILGKVILNISNI